MSDLTPQEVELRVRRWLEEEKYQIEPVQDQGFFFNLLVTTPLGLKLNVSQPRDVAHAVVIGTRLEVPKEIETAVSQLSHRDQVDFAWDLREILLESGIAFQIEPPDGLPKTVALVNRVFYDGLTQDTFAIRVQATLTAVVAVVWQFQSVGPIRKVERKVTRAKAKK